MATNESEQERISKFFSENSDQIEKWLKEAAPEEVVKKINQATTSKSQSTLCVTPSDRRQSISAEIFQQWLSVPSSQKQDQQCTNNKIRYQNRKLLEELDEGELFMELIRDVANELDIDVLCHKILVNVGLLTHADRGSLFLTKAQSSKKVLIAKLFDVNKETALDDALKRAKSEEIVIPFGVGIAGIVAETKQLINIKEAYNDPRFNSEIDLKTGYKTNAMLSMPILNYEEEVIGVAQIINKTNGSNEFDDRDVEVFMRYLTFCAIGIQNAQLFENSVLEYKRNQILLNLARSIFEEQNNLECLVTKIMMEAQELLKCERCAVFLMDWECCESSHLERLLYRPINAEKHQILREDADDRNFMQKEPSKIQSITQSANTSFNSSANIRFSKVFEMGKNSKSANVCRPSIEDINSSTLAQIASYVAATGELLNINNITEWLKTQKDQILIYEEDEIANNSKSILSMPIVNGQKNVIGVLVYVHESGSHFTNSDIAIFEAFAIFCGLGIHNTTMYESACKLMAKQKVALECLSYHATASRDQTLKLANDVIQPAETYKLYNFSFTDFELTDEDTCRATIRMFVECNLVSQFRIPYDVLCRWILSVKKNYRPVKYHNWRHALNVAQTMFAMMKTGKMERFMHDLEILGLLVACLCHDLDHRGTNNAFQLKTDSPLAILYSTSTMEHHHFDQCVMILNSEGNNIFQTLSPEDYKKVMYVVESAILSTDLAMYFKKKERFLELIDNGEFDWQSQEKKELLCGMMITACDVSAIAKPWEVQHKIAKLVADEFFDQGDLEKLQLNTQPIAMMDRERKDELPKMQVGFIDLICLPLYRTLAETFPWISPLYEGTLENRDHWQDLAEKVEMGLTWIDHDTIDKPIEGFSAHAEEIKEIELTVTTLNCQHNDADSPNSPPHERRPRFSSLKKSAGLPKSVKSRLNLIKNQAEKKEKEEEEASTAAENQETSLDGKKMKPVKKNSKICQLL